MNWTEHHVKEVPSITWWTCPDYTQCPCFPRPGEPVPGPGSAFVISWAPWMNLAGGDKIYTPTSFRPQVRGLREISLVPQDQSEDTPEHAAFSGSWTAVVGVPGYTKVMSWEAKISGLHQLPPHAKTKAQKPGRLPWPPAQQWSQCPLSWTSHNLQKTWHMSQRLFYSGQRRILWASVVERPGVSYSTEINVSWTSDFYEILTARGMEKCSAPLIIKLMKTTYHSGQIFKNGKRKGDPWQTWSRAPRGRNVDWQPFVKGSKQPIQDLWSRSFPVAHKSQHNYEQPQWSTGENRLKWKVSVVIKNHLLP